MEESLGKLWLNKIKTNHAILIRTTIEVLNNEVKSRIDKSSQEVIKQTVSNFLLTIKNDKQTLCNPIAEWLDINDLFYKLVNEGGSIILFVSFDKDILDINIKKCSPGV